MSKYKSEEEFLKDYDVTKYDRPSVSVDTLVFTIVDRKPQNYRKLPEKVLRALLIKRNDYPYKDKWALPGGFVKMDEDLETAALRELKEETNVDVDDVCIVFRLIDCYGLNLIHDDRFASFFENDVFMQCAI